MAKRKAKVKLNWFDRIAAARERGEFTHKDIQDASSWPDCACGEQSEFIPRDNGDFADGEPLDSKLVNLGGRFANAVEANKFNRAEEILKKIQIRSGEILREQLAEAEATVKGIRKELGLNK